MNQQCGSEATCFIGNSVYKWWGVVQRKEKFKFFWVGGGGGRCTGERGNNQQNLVENHRYKLGLTLRVLKL